MHETNDVSEAMQGTGEVRMTWTAPLKDKVPKKRKRKPYKSKKYLRKK
jgi:hypothetical protein